MAHPVVGDCVRLHIPTSDWLHGRFGLVHEIVLHEKPKDTRRPEKGITRETFAWVELKPSPGDAHPLRRFFCEITRLKPATFEDYEAEIVPRWKARPPVHETKTAGGETKAARLPEVETNFFRENAAC